MGGVGGPGEGTSLVPVQRRERAVLQLTLGVLTSAGTKEPCPALLLLSQQSRRGSRCERQLPNQP